MSIVQSNLFEIVPSTFEFPLAIVPSGTVSRRNAFLMDDLIDGEFFSMLDLIVKMLSEEAGHRVYETYDEDVGFCFIFKTAHRSEDVIKIGGIEFRFTEKDRISGPLSMQFYEEDKNDECVVGYYEARVTFLGSHPGCEGMPRALSLLPPDMLEQFYTQNHRHSAMLKDQPELAEAGCAL